MFDATKAMIAKNLFKSQTHSGTGSTSSAANVDITDCIGHAAVLLNAVTGGTTDTLTATVHDDDDNTLATFTTLKGTSDDKVHHEMLPVDLQEANGGKVYVKVTADGSTDTFTVAASLVARQRYAS